MKPVDPKKPAEPVVIDVVAEPVGQPVDAPPVIGVKQKLGAFRFRIAMAAAMALDLFQIALAPIFLEGIFSPLEDILDAMAFMFFWWLLGWNWMFLPSFMFKLVPFVDLAPTWTIAVGLAIRAKQKQS